MKTGWMTGKKGLIMGVANDRSLAWGIAERLAAEGAELAFSYPGEAIEKRVRPLAASLGFDFVEPCDVSNDQDIEALFERVKTRWGSLDFVVHAIGYSDKNELSGDYVNTSRANFLNTLDISCYSLTAITRAARPLLASNGGSIVTLTYLGAERVFPNYNVMGVAKAALESSVRYLAADLGPQKIRVNAISAGPVKTLAASGITDFRSMLREYAENTPLRSNITLKQVGDAALYLLSDLSDGVTGEVLHVDSGYHIMGASYNTNVGQN